jgi:hypothetical protein
MFMNTRRSFVKHATAGGLAAPPLRSWLTAGSTLGSVNQDMSQEITFARKLA